MIGLQKHMGDNIPTIIEYLGCNEWAVRWDIAETQSEDIHGYEYYELKFNEEPTYDLFVSKLIRNRYTQDEEDALKSNMVAQFMDGEIQPKYEEEWREFQTYRNEAKTIGKNIFNI